MGQEQPHKAVMLMNMVRCDQKPKQASQFALSQPLINVISHQLARLNILCIVLYMLLQGSTNGKREVFQSSMTFLFVSLLNVELGSHVNQGFMLKNFCIIGFAYVSCETLNFRNILWFNDRQIADVICQSFAHQFFSQTAQFSSLLTCLRGCAPTSGEKLDWSLLILMQYIFEFT